MSTTTRRRFLAISAGATVGAMLPGLGRARDAAGAVHVWRGVAMGAAATIALDHPDAPALCAAAAREIDRLEDIFSLYRADSALSRLNRTGSLTAAPPELLDCLSLVGLTHDATDGRFDPTIQPIWALYAARFSAGRVPSEEEIATSLTRVGWDRVAVRGSDITLRPGMALTLNGIAQGYVADSVVALLQSRGLRDVLIDTGETRALGGAPDGDWSVELPTGDRLGLRNRALATSAPLGTSFDQTGKVGHIIDPRSGRPAISPWRQVTVSAPRAAVADALSTAGCVLPDRQSIERAAAAFAGARIEALVGA
ncbi:FAD:protein FMN transferase [uncultured Paracoccus sp.]|uniref:FAD:protein FMN transferase n=1 Tax=uncultured Paracoccus sp. TaxID=189685 RepID=UPI00261DC8D3|nr:FAD:protein FMN transferase [uncultured Paracoccus sp.]